MIPWLGPLLFAATLHVPADYPTIQAALDAAVDGDVVLVAPGTYAETLDLLGKAVELRSDGGPAATVVAAGGAGSAVVCANGETPATRIEGFTFTGGSAPSGGGLLCVGASPTVRDCVLPDNIAQGSGGGLSVTGGEPSFTDCVVRGNGATFGAGSVVDGSDARFERCVFLNNTAFIVGGGMSVSDGEPTLIECRFESNYAPDGGGGMESNDALPLLVECTFFANRTSDRGGGFNSFGGPGGRFERCVFDSNLSTANGGAMYLDEASPLVLDCLFVGNIATDLGGVVRSKEGAPRFVRCVMKDNVASTGGAIASLSGSIVRLEACALTSNVAAEGAGGAVFDSPGSTVARRSYFTANRAAAGGGAVFVDGGSSDFRDCVFRANETDGEGGVALVQSGALELRGATAADNRSKGGAGGAARVLGGELRVASSILWGNAPDELSLAVGAIECVFSDVEGGYPGEGNLDADPLFADAAAGDLRLATGSPCIDAGSDGGLAGELLTPVSAELSTAAGEAATLLVSSSRARLDAGGLLRFFGGAPLDVGAYEYASEPPAADIAYWVLGSLSGTSPGLALGGLTLPLNPDAYFALTAKLPQPEPPLSGFAGALDTAGEAAASFAPAGLGLPVGLAVDHAFVAYDADTFTLFGVSNAAGLLLAP
ncbi:MAG: right-handed parallel beta-helix repeat-containing protein [Planctomycetota bacterium]